MDVSIVIPNYNGEEYIINCIASIYDQLEDKKAIIVIDNNSDDTSVVLIEETYPDITIIKNDVNLGFACAVNKGIKYSKSDFVILLNNDAFVKPNFVRMLYNCIDSDHNIFSASSKMLSYSNPNLIDNAGDQLCLLGWAFKTGDGQQKELFTTERIIFSACAGAAIYRRNTFEKIGYFDERFFAYLEDVDIGFRANIHGYINMYCPDAEVLHIGSATSGSNKYSEFKVELSSRNNVYMLINNLPYLLLLLNAPLIILGFIIKALFFMKAGFGKSYVYGLIEGFTTLKTTSSIEWKKVNIRNYIRIYSMMLKSTIYYFVIKIVKRN